jgi:peroxiredoxin
MPQSSPSLKAGQPAPDFTLPAIHREGTVSLADYRGRSPLLLALFRGIWCSFCRRAIIQLGLAAGKLEAVGVETLAVVATPAERARLYFRYRPTRLALAADPELATFRAFRVPRIEMTPRVMEEMLATRTTLGGALPVPMSILEASNVLVERDPLEYTPSDQEDSERQLGQLVAQFLVDRDGIVRWVNLEAGRDGLAGIGMFPTDEELLAAAARLRP